jgi:hypothetical protein
MTKMEGKIDLVFVGDSITARWRGNENWNGHWAGYNAINMDISAKFLEADGSSSKEVMGDFLHLDWLPKVLAQKGGF